MLNVDGMIESVPLTDVRWPDAETYSSNLIVASCQGLTSKLTASPSGVNLVNSSSFRLTLVACLKE